MIRSGGGGRCRVMVTMITIIWPSLIDDDNDDGGELVDG